MNMIRLARVCRRCATGAGMLLAFSVLALAACGTGGPGRAEPERPFRVAVISDLNSAYGSTEYGAEVGTAVALIRERWRPDLVLAAGDLIAGQRPSLTDDNVRAMWAAFDSTVAAPLRAAGIPFGFSLGNHDASRYPAHQRDRAFAIEHWRAPERRPLPAFNDSTHFPQYYSFRRGPIFVAVWDATSATAAGDTAMLRWLETQLTSAPARTAAFRIVLGHLPLYAVAEGRNAPGEVLDDADALRMRLERLGVHTYISGHHHAYYPGRRGAVELLHAGALGDGPRPLLGTLEPSPRTVTVLDFDAGSRAVRHTTHVLVGGEIRGTVALHRLPARIDGHNGYVMRRDIIE